MKSNLNIKSNVYIMPEEFSLILTQHSNEFKKFIQQIKNKAMFFKLPDHMQKYGTDFQKKGFGLCPSYPDEVNFGPILKNNKKLYVCRCEKKEICHNRKVQNRDEIMRTGKKLECKNCPRYEGNGLFENAIGIIGPEE